jgi:hypothetical protein
VRYRWLTRDNPDYPEGNPSSAPVCDDCRRLDNTTSTYKRSKPHPNCYCVQVPIPDSAETARRRSESKRGEKPDAWVESATGLIAVDFTEAELDRAIRWLFNQWKTDGMTDAVFRAALRSSHDDLVRLFRANLPTVSAPRSEPLPFTATRPPVSILDELAAHPGGPIAIALLASLRAVAEDEGSHFYGIQGTDGCPASQALTGRVYDDRDTPAPRFPVDDCPMPGSCRCKLIRLSQAFPGVPFGNP